MPQWWMETCYGVLIQDCVNFYSKGERPQSCVCMVTASQSIPVSKRTYQNMFSENSFIFKYTFDMPHLSCPKDRRVRGLFSNAVEWCAFIIFKVSIFWM